MNPCVLQRMIARIVRSSVPVTAVMVLVLGATGVNRAQTNGAKASAHQEAAPVISTVQAKEVAAQPGEPRAKGVDTGIKVHGHWVINVFSPNGQLVSHTEFENSLQSTGMSMLANVLGQRDTVGFWELSFAGTSGPCTTLYPVNGGACIITQGGATGTICGSGKCQSNMPAPTVLPNGTMTQLVGALTFPSAGNVTQVETIVNFCSGAIAPSVCAATPSSNLAIFTSANLPTPVSVAANQLVQITVTFSFS
jgi:hypothetical protein